MVKPLAFISHRTQDMNSSIAARFIKNELDTAFGADKIFMDVDGLSIGDVWSQELKDRLNDATVLIVIISDNWLKISDDFGRRLIDKEKDWVKFEIETSLRRNIKILPILVRADMPPIEALPESIAGIRAFQYFRLRVNDWRNDVEKLVEYLSSSNFAKVNKLDVLLPEIPKNKHYPLPYNVDELKRELITMKGWEIINMENDGVAIRRQYVFKSFKKAISYMYELTGYVSQMQHHPIWENRWRTIIVTLTTWDIGNRVTIWDVEMARYFDQFYKEHFR